MYLTYNQTKPLGLGPASTLEIPLLDLREILQNTLQFLHKADQPPSSTAPLIASMAILARTQLAGLELQLHCWPSSRNTT